MGYIVFDVKKANKESLKDYVLRMYYTDKERESIIYSASKGSIVGVVRSLDNGEVYPTLFLTRKYNGDIYIKDIAVENSYAEDLPAGIFKYLTKDNCYGYDDIMKWHEIEKKTNKIAKAIKNGEVISMKIMLDACEECGMNGVFYYSPRFKKNVLKTETGRAYRVTTKQIKDNIKQCLGKSFKIEVQELAMA